jgi:hypothetical protein
MFPDWLGCEFAGEAGVVWLLSHGVPDALPAGTGALAVVSVEVLGARELRMISAPRGAGSVVLVGAVAADAMVMPPPRVERSTPREVGGVAVDCADAPGDAGPLVVVGAMAAGAMVMPPPRVERSTPRTIGGVEG